MARHLAGAGHEVHAYNRSPDRARPLAEHGVELHGDPAAAASGRDIVLTMLSDADAVLDVVARAGLAQGQVWWQASTIGLEATERCARLAADGA